MTEGSATAGTGVEYGTILTTCPYCGCGCNFFLETIGGRLTGVIPCKEHVISQGKLCIKGHNAHAFVQSPKRLIRPLVKKDGELVETSWDEALDLVASKLKELKGSHGPDSLGMLCSAKCTNEENYVMMKFARAVLGTNNVDHCARLCHASTVAGLAASFGSGAMTNSQPEFEDVDCVLITGSNTVEAHPLIASRLLRARDKGAKIIVADPREIPMAGFADLYLRFKPGTDVAWLNGMMSVIISEDLHDEGFAREKCEEFEALKRAVGGYPPEKVEEITGIPADRLREAARTYAGAEKGSIVYSMGITQHSTGTDNVRSIANLAMLTGNLGKPSTGVNPLRGQNNVQGACDMGALPNVYSGYQKVEDEASRRKLQEAWGCDSLPGKSGLTVVEMVNAAGQGTLKGMYIVGENPMVSDPDLGHVEDALDKLDFLVVQDLFLTETAMHADVVLPSASYAEKDGTFTATDRRVQRVRKAIEPVGESRPDWWVVSELAKRMGSSGFDYGGAEDVFNEMAGVTPSYGGMSYGRIEKEGSLCWPCPAENHPGTPYLHKDGSFTRGKGLFAAIEYVPPREEPDGEYPFILTTGRVMWQFHTGTMTRKSPKLETEAPFGFVEINPEDAASLGISDGATVKVESRRGAIEVTAQVTERVGKGVVFIPFHYAEAAANVLTNAALDPVAKIPELKVCAVRISA